MPYYVLDEEMTQEYLSQHYLRSAVEKREKDHITIVDEISGSEAREALAKQRSWLVVNKTEKKLRSEATELQEKIDQLKRLLDQPFISPFVRDSVNARVRELESELRRKSSYVWTTSLKSTYAYVHSEPTKNTFLRGIFIAHYVEGSTHWRAIQVRITRASHVENEDIITRLPQTLDSIIGINKDSLSHFQNCPLPPLTPVNPINRTQERHINLLTKGCFVRSSPYIRESNPSGGNVVWKTPRRSLTSALGPCEEPPPQNPVGSLNCSTSYFNFSKNIQTMCQKPCQSYSDFTEVFLRETMQRHSISYISSSFLSGFLEKSEDFQYGEMN